MKKKSKNLSLKLLIIELWSYISKNRKKQLFLILLTVILASLSELISLGAVIPFLEVLSNPEKYFKYPFIQPIINILGISSIPELIIASHFFVLQYFFQRP